MKSIFSILRSLFTIHSLKAKTKLYTINKLIFSSDFTKGYDSSLWHAEIAPQPPSSVYTKNGKLVLDTKGGVTVWLKKLLKGNILIEYKRKVLVDTGANDRLSDLNNFWMATDPSNSNLFTRHGVLEEYDSLLLYYVGMGGNSNRTTRFRKYLGNGQLPLLKEYTDPSHLLKANHEYTITIIIENGVTQYFADGELYFSYEDPKPLTEGYFGFRSTKSRQEISDLKIYSIK